MAALVACDIHPLNNLRVLTSLRADLSASDEQVAAWAARWITAGFGALEPMIERHGDGFAFGDAPTLADCCLVPQIFNAKRLDTDLSGLTRTMAVFDACMAQPAFQRAQPSSCPDAET
jgi:maleylacetoacetate isomerase